MQHDNIIIMTTASDFLSHLYENVPSFVTGIVAQLKSKYDIDVTNLQADHVCYRTESIAQYTTLVKALQSAEASDSFTLLVESEIGGRTIATFKLAQPIEIDSGNDGRDYSIDVIEIPSPKEGSPYDKGLEHIEFVIGDGTHKSPMNDEVHAAVLHAWMGKYQSISWSTKAFHKQCNPDVSLKMQVYDYGGVSVKFHLIPLEAVIKFEKTAKHEKSNEAQKRKMEVGRSGLLLNLLGASDRNSLSDPSDHVLHVGDRKQNPNSELQFSMNRPASEPSGNR